MEDYFKESRKRLEEITKELNREKFLRWASANVSCLRELNRDELQALRYHYDNAESWRKVVDSTFSMTINNLNGTNKYSDDLDKNRKHADLAVEKLDDFIKFLEQKHGVAKTTEVSTNDELKR